MKAFILPLIDLLFEAFNGGVSQDALVAAIKKEMTEIARKQIQSELQDEPPSTEPERK
jgi:hypothetical protein